MTRTPLHLVALLGTALASCAAPGAPPAPTAPPELVLLFDQLAPDGALELEFDRHGRFGDMEAEVSVALVPEVVREAVARAHPGVELTSAEREFQSGAWTWEVGFEEEGRGVQVVVSDAGELLETERELEPWETLDEVLVAAEATLRYSTLVSVDHVTSASGEEYHVKRELQGARYKIVVTPKGEVLRTLREARAEIEIPVALEVLGRP
ncbi:MAG: hypothetical protein AAGB93_07310 [Planctomycetota bacterium]